MNINRFAIPELPLPLNNTLIHELVIDGKNYYITAGYSNFEPILLVFDDSYVYKTIKLPHDYSVPLAPYQGKLICGLKKLISLDIISEKYEMLSEDPIGIKDGPWSGKIFKNFLVIGVSDKGDEIVVFDLDNKKIVAKIPTLLDSYYIYQSIITPDEKILIAGSVPRVSFLLVDPSDWSFQPFYGEVPEKNKVNYYNIFLNDQTLYMTSSYASFLFSYPDFKLIKEIKWPEGIALGANQRQATTFKGMPILWDSENSDFYVYQLSTEKFIKLNNSPVDFQLADNGLAGFIERPNHHILGLKTNGICFEVSPNGDVEIIKEMKAFSRGKGWGLVLAESKNHQKLFGCSHCVQHMWEIDLKNDTSRYVGKCGPGGGQINGTVWDKENEELFIASYASCSLMRYKPSLDEIPQLMVTLGHKQTRPLGLKKFQMELWMISLAKLGNRGGALSCYHIDKGELTYFMDILEEQSPQSMLLDTEKGILYLSLSIYPEGAEPIRSKAGIIHFDLKQKKVLYYFEPLPNAETIHFFTFLPNGNILMQDQKPLSPIADLYEYNPNSKTVKRLGPSPADLREVILNPMTKEIIGTSKNGILKLSIEKDFKINYVVEINQLTNRKDSMAKYLNFSESGELFGVLDEMVFSVKL